MKLVDIENFKEICVKTLASLKALLKVEEVDVSFEEVSLVKCEPYSHESEGESDVPLASIRTEVPKKRGRPKKTVTFDIPQPDEETISQSPPLAPARKRGRPRKCDDPPSKRKRSESVEHDNFDEPEKFTGRVMRYGDFCQKVLRKYYPKPPRRTDSLIITSKLDTYCHICNANVKPYRKHLYQVHYTKIGSKFACKICSKFVPGMYQVVKHFDEHRQFEVPQKCPVCEETFDSMTPYKAHLHTHDHTNAYPCPDCDKCYNQIKALNYHLITVHLMQFVCHQCFLVFDNEKEHRRHYKEEMRKIKAGINVKAIKKIEPDEIEDLPLEASENFVKVESHETIQTGITHCTHCDVEIYDYTHHLVTVRFFFVAV